MIRTGRGILILAAVLLAACSPAAASQAPVQSTDYVPASASGDAPEAKNLAIHKHVTASGMSSGRPTSNAVDGELSTSWSSGSLPQWIQIDLGAPMTVSGIRLTIAQDQAGETIHQLFAGPSPSNWKRLQEFQGTTSDGQVLEYNAAEPLTGIQTIRILTIKGPSAVGWKEIEVLGPAGSPPPSGQADIVFFNGTVLTMEKGSPDAQAVSIQGDKILFVGGNEQALALQGPLTRLIDLNGMTLTPGFINSHSHRIGDRSMLADGEIPLDELFAGILKEGWTSTHELFVTDQRMDELKSLAWQDKLPIRVSAYLAVGYDYDYRPWYRDAGYRPLQQFTPYLQIAGIKITLDREWGEQIFFDQQQLNSMVTDATAAGWQVATHSFSPKANAELLNAYELALKGGSNESLRLRHEHIGILTPDLLQKEARLGIIASVQLVGTAVYADDASFHKYIAQELWPSMSPWRDMINAGIPMIGNLDDPWCCTAWRRGSKKSYGDPTVIQALYQGMTRTYFTGRQPEPWQASQVVTAQEALEMMTINGAYAAHQENVIGSLKPGKYADMVILSGNPLTTPTADIPKLEVVMTVVGGGVKYCQAGREAICGLLPSP